MVDLAVHGSPIWGEGGQAQRLLDQWVPDIRSRAPATASFVIVSPIHIRGWAFWGKGLRLYLKQYLFGRFNAMESRHYDTRVGGNLLELGATAYVLPPSSGAWLRKPMPLGGSFIRASTTWSQTSST